MTQVSPSEPLPDALSRVAAAWCSAQSDADGSVPRSRLGKLAVGDGGFFEKLPGMKRGPTTSQLEKFARFLHDPANWPEGLVPVEACELAHRVGVSADAADLSAGKPAELSSEEAA